MKQCPVIMAEAGFFYCNVCDEVQCYLCGVRVSKWLPEDDPWIQHAKWSKHCRFLLRKKGVEFVNRANSSNASTFLSSSVSVTASKFSSLKSTLLAKSPWRLHAQARQHQVHHHHHTARYASRCQQQRYRSTTATTTTTAAAAATVAETVSEREGLREHATRNQGAVAVAAEAAPATDNSNRTQCIARDVANSNHTENAERRAHATTTNNNSSNNDVDHNNTIDNANDAKNSNTINNGNDNNNTNNRTNNNNNNTDDTNNSNVYTNVYTRVYDSVYADVDDIAAAIDATVAALQSPPMYSVTPPPPPPHPSIVQTPKRTRTPTPFTPCGGGAIRKLPTTKATIATFDEDDDDEDQDEAAADGDDDYYEYNSYVDESCDGYYDERIERDEEEDDYDRLYMKRCPMVETPRLASTKRLPLAPTPIPATPKLAPKPVTKSTTTTTSTLTFTPSTPISISTPTLMSASTLIATPTPIPTQNTITTLPSTPKPSKLHPYNILYPPRQQSRQLQHPLPHPALPLFTPLMMDRNQRHHDHADSGPFSMLSLTVTPTRSITPAATATVVSTIDAAPPPPQQQQPRVPRIQIVPSSPTPPSSPGTAAEVAAAAASLSPSSASSSSSSSTASSSKSLKCFSFSLMQRRPSALMRTITSVHLQFTKKHKQNTGCKTNRHRCSLENANRASDCHELASASDNKVNEHRANGSSRVDPNADRQGDCLLCCSHRADIVILPCKHLVLCGWCITKQMDKCPVCRGSNVEIMKIYF